eukprot:TRINITY_DN557_c0_g1_i6.p1 TRINITY_DN557_c0_g1~~TRINITY_DN557_c0_g1_i6.p1  ORF type:complete len:531 (-),score=143.10 TRINITY_DN557_c0_g1_i6:321-1913(-)
MAYPALQTKFGAVYEELWKDFGGDVKDIIHSFFSWMHSTGRTPEDPEDDIGVIFTKNASLSSSASSSHPSSSGSTKDKEETFSSQHQRRLLEFRILDKVISDLNHGVTLDEVLDFVWENFSTLIPYDRMGFTLLGADNVLRARYARSKSTSVKIALGYKLPIEQTSLMKIAESGRPRIINDLEEYLEEHPHSSATKDVLEEGGRSSLTCPLLGVGKPVGFLFFTSFSKRTYRDEHCDAFVRLAGTLSVAVEKSHIYQELLKEQQTVSDLLNSLFPTSMVPRLLRPEDQTQTFCGMASIILVSFGGWKDILSVIEPEEMSDVLNSIAEVDEAIQQEFSIDRVYSQPTSTMFVHGLGKELPRSGHHALEAALAYMERFQVEMYSAQFPVVARVAVATGVVCGSVVGRKQLSFSVWGTPCSLVTEMMSACPPQSIVICHSTRDQCGPEMEEHIQFIETKDDGVMGGENYFEVKRVIKDLTHGRSAVPGIQKPMDRRRAAGLLRLKHLGQRRESLVSAFRKKVSDSSEGDVSRD